MGQIRRNMYVIIYKLIIFFRSLEEKVKNVYYSNICEMNSDSYLHIESRIYNYKSKEFLRIGSGTHIRGELCVISDSKGLSIGANSFVGINSIVRSYNEIHIGDNVLIAHNVTIIDSDSHEIDHIERAKSYYNMVHGNKRIEESKCCKTKSKPIIIKDYAWISYNVSILKGVTIGKGAIVGAGSVVTSDIPDFTLAIGNPAKIIKELPHYAK